MDVSGLGEDGLGAGVVLTVGLAVLGAGRVTAVVGSLFGGTEGGMVVEGVVTGLWTTTGAWVVVRTRGLAVVVGGLVGCAGSGGEVP